jgi:hypothetical protein
MAGVLKKRCTAAGEPTKDCTAFSRRSAEGRSTVRAASRTGEFGEESRFQATSGDL